MMLSSRFASMIAAAQEEAQQTTQNGFNLTAGGHTMRYTTTNNQNSGDAVDKKTDSAGKETEKKPLISNRNTIIMLSVVEIALAVGTIAYDVHLERKIEKAEEIYTPKKTRYDAKVTVQQLLADEVLMKGAKVGAGKKLNSAALAREGNELKRQQVEIDNLKTKSRKTALFGAVVGVAGLSIQLLQQPFFLASALELSAELNQANSALLEVVESSETRLFALRDEQAQLEAQIAAYLATNYND
jgi:hypothetical protein